MCGCRGAKPSRRQRELAFDVEALINEAKDFPNGANDDQVDATSQYLIQSYLIGGEATLMSRPVDSDTVGCRAAVGRERGRTRSSNG